MDLSLASASAIFGHKSPKGMLYCHSPTASIFSREDHRTHCQAHPQKTTYTSGFRSAQLTNPSLLSGFSSGAVAHRRKDNMQTQQGQIRWMTMLPLGGVELFDMAGAPGTCLVR
jgi:hypothetical protein